MVPPEQSFLLAASATWPALSRTTTQPGSASRTSQQRRTVARSVKTARTATAGRQTAAQSIHAAMGPLASLPTLRTSAAALEFAAIAACTFSAVPTGTVLLFMITL